MLMTQFSFLSLVPSPDVSLEIIGVSCDIFTMGTFHILHCLMHNFDMQSQPIIPIASKVTFFTLEIFRLSVDTFSVPLKSTLDRT